MLDFGEIFFTKCKMQNAKCKKKKKLKCHFSFLCKISPLDHESRLISSPNLSKFNTSSMAFQCTSLNTSVVLIFLFFFPFFGFLFPIFFFFILTRFERYFLISNAGIPSLILLISRQSQILIDVMVCASKHFLCVAKIFS